MKITAREKKFDFKPKDTIAIFLTEEYQKENLAQIPPTLSFIKEKISFRYFKAKPGEVMFAAMSDSPAVIIAGLGKREDITRESLRNAAASVIETCKRKRISSVCVIPPALEKIRPPELVQSMAEGLCLSNYVFSRYKSKSDELQKPVEEAIICTEWTAGIQSLLDETRIICENSLECRNLINETSDQSNPVAIAKEARRLSGLRGVSCTVYGKRDIEKMRMGLLLAVSRGSAYPPQLVVLRYRGNPRSTKSLAIVGKGITFDSGGLNLKPSGHIEDMRTDMSGAAACLYAVRAAAQLRLKKNLYAVIPLCENMVGNTSYRPGDVYTSYSGKSVEIGNTDAEGRLILADAIAFAEHRLKPSRIIDIATLTGACLVCFGEIIAGLLSNNDDLAETLFEAGESTGERLWRLPLYKEYGDDLKSDIADTSNVSSSRNAGTIVGAMFIKNFVRNTPWAHIDIAGTAYISKQRGYRPKHATGYGVRLLIETLKRLED